MLSLGDEAVAVCLSLSSFDQVVVVVVVIQKLVFAECDSSLLSMKKN